MKRNENYNTKQKEIINEIINSFKDLFTSKDVYEESKNRKLNVGLTTIYRHLEELEENNVITKYYVDNVKYYKTSLKCDCANHFFLRCKICGTVTHVNCDCVESLLEHITVNHGFIIDESNIMINGICSDCNIRGRIC